MEGVLGSVSMLTPGKDKCGVDLFSMRCHSVACGTASRTPIRHAKFRSRSHRAVARIYDEAGNIIGTHEQTGHFEGP